MKKIIAILAVVISVGAFAQNQTLNHSSQTTKDHSTHQKGGMMSQVNNLTPEQQAEFNELRANHRSSMQNSMLDIKEVNLKMQREMLAENPNQKNIENLIDQKSKLQAENQKDMLKFRLDAKEKFGIEMTGGIKGKKNCGIKGSMTSKHMNKSNHKNHQL